MSADNMIYIQRRGKAWYVWMGFASDDRKPRPPKDCEWFDTEELARVYALGWMRGKDIVEYGIVWLAPKDGDTSPSHNAQGKRG